LNRDRKMVSRGHQLVENLTQPSVLRAGPAFQPDEAAARLQLRPYFELNHVGRAAVDFQVDGTEQQVGEVVFQAQPLVVGRA
jgi:hypothetical protein